MAEAAEKLDAQQLRQLITHIVEHVDDAADLALRFVDAHVPGSPPPTRKQRSLSLLNLSSMVRWCWVCGELP